MSMGNGNIFSRIETDFLLKLFSEEKLLSATMARAEIEIFILKFKGRLLSDKNAILVI
jgi:hypothetical protein